MDADTDRVARQLTALRLLLNTERNQHEADILLATVFEALDGDNDRTSDELISTFRTDWPEVSIPREMFEATLHEAELRGLLVSTDRLGGSSAWKATPAATADVRESREWASAVVDRCRRQLADRARSHGLECGVETAERWADILLDALNSAVARSSHLVPVRTREVATRLFPPYDVGDVRAAVNRRVDDPDVAQFLVRSALAALDPGSPFGSEVVHYLATGYVLHAFLLGRELDPARKEIGSLAGEVLLLDTPVLLRMMSLGESFRWTADFVGGMARRVGATVAVTDRTLTELRSTLASRRPDAKRIAQEMRDGLSREPIATAVTDEILAIWLSDPRRLEWSQFEASVTNLWSTLRALGVVVGFVPDGWASDDGRSETFTSHIKTVTEVKKGVPRRPRAAEHDGQLMSMVEFLRKAKNSLTMWPGAFIVTPDRSLSDAYSVECEDGAASACLTVSQAAALLARVAPPVEAEKLAELIVGDQQWQTRFRRAASMGVEQSIELARVLMGTPEADLQFDAIDVQLTFDEIISGADFDGDQLAAVRAALTQREATRMKARTEHNRERDAEIVRERERLARSEGHVQALAQRITTTEAERDAEAERGDGLADTTEDLQRKLRIRDRLILAVVLYATGVVLLVAGVAAGWLDDFAWAGPAAAMAASLKWVHEWVRDPDSSWTSLIASVGSWIGFAVLGHVIADWLASR